MKKAQARGRARRDAGGDGERPSEGVTGTGAGLAHASSCHRSDWRRSAVAPKRGTHARGCSHPSGFDAPGSSPAPERRCGESEDCAPPPGTLPALQDAGPGGRRRCRAKPPAHPGRHKCAAPLRTPTDVDLGHQVRRRVGAKVNRILAANEGLVLQIEALVGLDAAFQVLSIACHVPATANRQTVFFRERHDEPAEESATIPMQ